MEDTEQSHMERVQKQFALQAENFDREGYSLSNKEYLKWAIGNIPLHRDIIALDVAAGTGILSRELARYVKKVYAIDASDSMIRAGRDKVAKSKLSNVIFEKGLAQSLPYDDNEFDLVACRLALHHFYDVKAPFDEMLRVTKPGGYIVIMDLISPEDKEVATRYNKLETLRDSSHTYALTKRELLALFKDADVPVEKSLTMDVEMVVDDWLALTRSSKDVQATVKDALEHELAGGDKTGMRPYMKHGVLHFLHKWMLVVAQKC